MSVQSTSEPLSRNEQFGAAAAIISGVLAKRLDESGEPLLHSLKIAARMTDPTCRTIAVLHEVVRDKVCSAVDLRGCFEDIVVDAVVSLTHNHKEPFRSYIERVAENHFAVPVKIACLWDLMDQLSRKTVMGSKEIDLMEQFQWGADRLLNGRPALQQEQPLVQIEGIR